MADDSYKTIKQVAEGYYTEKRSRFISYAIPVRTVEEVKEQLEKYRKQYYDARHVCWAYMLGPERQTFRANDDGEPSSTAGKPILGQINSNELTDLLIVVVRYFGGIELGTSGLIVAYRTAAADGRAPPRGYRRRRDRGTYGRRGHHGRFRIPIPERDHAYRKRG
jgi:thymidylate synthase